MCEQKTAQSRVFKRTHNPATANEILHIQTRMTTNFGDKLNLANLRIIVSPPIFSLL